MEKYVQKLELQRSDIYKDAKIAEFGTREVDFKGMGTKKKKLKYKPREVVCVQACRTPFGKFGGKLKQYDAPQLGALAIKELLRRVSDKITPEDIDYVVMGQVVPAGCGQVPARQAAILAGLPEHVPAISINKVCSSGIKAVDLGVQLIQTGRAEIVIAGGMESMSNCPFALKDHRWGQRMALPQGSVLDLMVYDGLWDPFYNRHMAIHGSETSDEFGFTREDNDKWAYRSQMTAKRAMEEGRLDNELFAVEVKVGKSVEVFNKDEQPRPETTLEALAKLPPVFNHKSTVTGEPGSITAGNAPGINDGSGVLMLMSRELAEEMGFEILFTVLDYAEVSQPTKDIALVPGLAIKKVLDQNEMDIKQVDLIEINEAFAAVTLISGRRVLGLSEQEMDEKVNVNGGAIAYGHPIGATGARILMTLAYELKRRGGGVGVCGICSGLAQGDAMLIRV